jgi:hypothetical protein
MAVRLARFAPFAGLDGIMTDAAFGASQRRPGIAENDPWVISVQTLGLATDVIIY